MAEKGLLLGVTAHMGLECVATGMIGALARAVSPLAGIARALRSNVIILHMSNQLVAVGQVSHSTALPRTHGDLIGSHGVFVCAG
jgi:hypothetical protein